MTSDDQPTQPLTDAELARMDRELTDAVERDGKWYLTTDAPRDMRRLLAEVDRLRAELAAQAQKLEERTTQWRALLNLRDRDAQVFMAHRAAFDRLQSERNALVAKLGLDWGSDEFGDLSDVLDREQSCGDASVWSCALGDHCVCKKTKHGGRHECACGSWWFRDK